MAASAYPVLALLGVFRSCKPPRTPIKTTAAKETRLFAQRLAHLGASGGPSEYYFSEETDGGAPET